MARNNSNQRIEPETVSLHLWPPAGVVVGISTSVPSKSCLMMRLAGHLKASITIIIGVCLQPPYGSKVVSAVAVAVDHLKASSGSTPSRSGTSFVSARAPVLSNSETLSSRLR